MRGDVAVQVGDPRFESSLVRTTTAGGGVTLAPHSDTPCLDRTTRGPFEPPKKRISHGRSAVGGANSETTVKQPIARGRPGLRAF